MFFFSILTSDALSVSLLEAMAHGCIPIVSDLPDNREWVEDNKNGIILKPGATRMELQPLEARHVEIFDHNRRMIAEKAHFPSAIAGFCDRLHKMQ
jgi:glycosyltransferase involved in cell wall biosynthesis